MIQNLVTGFLIGLGVGGGCVLFYVERRNKKFETYVKQLTTDHTMLQGQYSELEKRYQVMQATKAAQKITAPIAQPMMSYFGDQDDGRVIPQSQLYERFGGPEQ
jgi:hypothetical protein